MTAFKSSITELGFASQMHSVPDSFLAEYAGLAREVTAIAIEDELTEKALKLNLFTGDTAAAGFGLSRSRGPAQQDYNKYTLQLGVQSEGYANGVVAANRQPDSLRRLWGLQPRIIEIVINLARSALSIGLESENLASELLDVNESDLNIHIRTNWYRGALAQRPESEQEILSGHTDRGPFTLHLYETDSGFLVGSAYPKQLALDLCNPERKNMVAKMRESLLPIEPGVGRAAILLGAGWWNLPKELMTGSVSDLPACYHVGIQMAESHDQSLHKDIVVSDPADRVSLVAFVDPPLSMLEAGRYTVPPREVARPDY